MCLAVPLQISRLKDERTAVVRQGEAELEVDVSLLEDPRPGEHVIVHAGFAIQRLDMQEAQERIELFRELGQAALSDARRASEQRPPAGGGSWGRDR